eukprot:363576-Chlamydomonas_euryale.AAC.4
MSTPQPRGRHDRQFYPHARACGIKARRQCGGRKRDGERKCARGKCGNSGPNSSASFASVNSVPSQHPAARGPCCVLRPPCGSCSRGQQPACNTRKARGADLSRRRSPDHSA